MKTLSKKNRFIFKLRGGGLLSSLSVISLFGVGFSSWVIKDNTNSIYIENLKVNAESVEYTSGSSLRLNPSKGNNGNGVDNLQYCNTGLATGLVYDDEIGSKGSVKYYFIYLLINLKRVEIIAIYL